MENGEFAFRKVKHGVANRCYLLSNSGVRTLYDTLGVPKTASPEEITRAYRKVSSHFGESYVIRNQRDEAGGGKGVVE